MKKSLFLFFGCASSLVLLSCGEVFSSSSSTFEGTSSAPFASESLSSAASSAPFSSFSSSLESLSSSPSSYVYQAGSSLLFQAFASGENAAERAVCLANIGAEPLSLDGYSLEIYHGGSALPEYHLPLQGNLKEQSVYVIVSSTADETWQKQADLVSDELVNNGTYPMLLARGNTYFDVLGFPGYQTSWGNKTSLLRKNEYRVARERFEAYDWVYFPCEDISHLGVFACPLSEERLLEGPHLGAADFNAEYFLSDVLGGGGTRSVSVASYGDGDTTCFTYPAEFQSHGFGNGHSFRYQNIDTPEVQHGSYIDAQPWGEKAADFTNALLRDARHILVQSIANGSITETYGRLLGFVWYTNVSSPLPADYILLNHAIVKAGYSKVAFSGVATNVMMSDGLSYYSYLLDANFRAEKLGLKVHGETDPSFVE